MLGDHQKQEQKQNVKQIVQNQDSKIEVTCDHYINSFIESMEKKLKDMLEAYTRFDPEVAVVNNELKKARKVNVLQHHGHVTKIFCSLLADDFKCKSSKNSGNRCYLLGPAPASASAQWKIQNEAD